MPGLFRRDPNRVPSLESSTQRLARLFARECFKHNNKWTPNKYGYTLWMDWGGAQLIDDREVLTAIWVPDLLGIDKPAGAFAQERFVRLFPQMYRELTGREATEVPNVARALSNAQRALSSHAALVQLKETRGV